MNKLLLKSILFLMLFSFHHEAKSCHAVALVNPSITVTPNGVLVDAFSSSVTCGCTNQYWLDIEVRCLNEPFDAAPFNPGFWGPLTTYPYFQSQILNKTGCNQEAYPQTNIPFTSLCPGVDYQIRFRENHNGDVGPWTTPFTFTVPGISTPFNVDIVASDSVVCPGNCTDIDVIISGGCGLAPIYDWTHGPSTGSITECPTETTTYTVTVTEQCTGDQITQSITIDTLNFLNAGSIEGLTDLGVSGDNLEVCDGDTITLEISNQNGDIQWQQSDDPNGPWNDLPNANSQVFTSPQITSTTYFRAEITACLDTVHTNYVFVAMKPVPVLTIPDFEICQGTEISIQTDVDEPGGIYSWNPSGHNGPDINNITPNQSVNYVLTYDLNGCVSVDSSIVTVYATPIAGFSVENICEGQLAEFIDETTVTNNENDVISIWNWDFGDGETSNDQNPLHNYATENNYVVSLDVETNYGCTSSFTSTIGVYPNPTADFSTIDVCLEQPSQFIDLSSVPVGNTNNGIVTWNWDFDDGNDSNIQNPIHTYTTDDTYDVKLVVITNNNCSDSIIHPVTIHAKPIANFAGSDTESCSPVCFLATSTSTVTQGTEFENFKWSFSNGVTFNTSEPFLTECFVNNTNNAIFLGLELEVTTEHGCTNSINQEDFIRLYYNPIAAFDYSPYDPNILEPEVEFYNNSEKAIAYEWDIEDHGIITDFEPIIEFDDQGPKIYDVQLVAFTEDGCTDTVRSRVDVKDIILFYVPNTFTPDDDMFNQTWKPVFTAGYDPYDFHLMIFNRAGEVIFETYNADFEWDGTYGVNSNKYVKDGTYVWKMEFKETMSDKRHIHTGHVTILR